MLKICTKISLCFACLMGIIVMADKGEYRYLFIPCATVLYFLGEWLLDASEEYLSRNPLPLDSTRPKYNQAYNNNYAVQPMTEEERREWYNERGWEYNGSTTDYSRYQPPTKKQRQETAAMLVSKCSRNVTLSIAK